jgi:hypothetical protein
MHNALAVGLLFIQLAVQTSASEHGEQRSLLEMIACTAALQTAYLQQTHVKDAMSTERCKVLDFQLGSVILGQQQGNEAAVRRSLLLQGAGAGICIRYCRCEPVRPGSNLAAQVNAYKNQLTPALIIDNNQVNLKPAHSSAVGGEIQML